MNLNIRIFALSFFIVATMAPAASSTPAQAVGLQFLAASTRDVPVLFRAQPNCTGAVGPTQYIEYSNQNLRSFNKFTGQPDGILDTDPATIMGTPMADAMMTFDRWGQRWILSGDLFDFVNPLFGGGSIAIAWSDGPIITKDSTWTVYHFDPAAIHLPGSAFVDSPKLSSDQNAVYINPVTYDTDLTFNLGNTIIVIPQSSFVKGNEFEFNRFFILTFQTTFGEIFTPSPDNYDPNPRFGYVVASPAALENDFYWFFRIINPGNENSIIYPAEPATPMLLEAPEYVFAFLVPHKGNLYGDNGLLQNETGLDFGMPHIRDKQLYFVNVGTVDFTGTATLSGDRSAILWYQYDLTGDPSGQGSFIETFSTIPALVQSGMIFDSTDTTTPLNYWNPAIMTDKNNNIAIIGNVAGETEFVQAFYTGRKATDQPGTLRSITLLTNNNEPFNFGTEGITGFQRWGDYCSLKPDASDENNLWATSQIVSEANNFGILTTKLIPVP